MDIKWTLRNNCANKSYCINKSLFRVGRHRDHEIVCSSAIISREHASFLLESNNLYIKDLGSSNGTFLNGRKLVPRQKEHIHNSDIISLGLSTHPNPCNRSNCFFYKAYSEQNFNSTLDVVNCLAEEENETVKAENTIPHAEHILATNNGNKVTALIGQTLKDGEEMEWNCGATFNSNEKENIQENSSVRVKTEPEPNQLLNIEYSIEDNVLVINDDEDINNELSSSQLFPANDPFMHIKEELQEIDYCRERPLVLVDSDDDDTDLDLFSILCSEPVTNLNSNTDLLSPATTTNHDGNILKTDTNGEYSLKCNDIFQEETSSKFKDNNAVNSNPETREQNESSNNIATLSSNFNNKKATEQHTFTIKPSTSKYLKPPIIEAPALTKSTSSNSKSKQNVPKRKSTSNDTKNESKKPKLRDEKNQKPTTSRRSARSSNTKKEDISKGDKLKIKETRKDRLKDLSKSTKKPESPKIPPKFSKPCVKQSESRGTFMLDNTPVPTTIKKRPDVIPNRNSKVTAANLQMASSSSENTNKRSKSTDPRSDAKFKSTVAVNGYANSMPSTSTAPVEYMFLKPNGALPRQDSRPNQNIRSHNRSLFEKPAFNNVLNFLNWRTSWLEEQKIRAMPPPVNKKSAVKMCNSFANHNDYCNIVVPLLVLELWNEVYQDWLHITPERQADRKFSCKITEINSTPNYCILKCTALITKQQNVSKQHVKEYNMVIVHVPMKQDNHFVYQPFFGFVTALEKRTIKGNDFIDPYLSRQLKPHSAEAILHFDLAVKATSNVISRQYCIEGAALLSLVPLMREFDAVYNLANSPLCQHILDPQVRNYTIKNHLSTAEYNMGNLNKVQKQVVLEASNLCLNDKPGIYLVQGPPGTGKTTVIKYIVRNVILNNLGKRIRLLLTAPSNSAIDGLVLKIIKELKSNLTEDEKKQIKLVRIGPRHAVNDEVKPYLLDSFSKQEVTRMLLKENPAVRRDYDTLLEERNKLKAEIEKQKECGNLNQLKQKHTMVDDKLENFAQNYLRQAYQKEFIIARKRMLDGSNIICTTLSSCIRLQEISGTVTSDITCCIVDEATQSKESETLIPLMLGINKVILIGDPRQLPAVTISTYAKELEHGQSLFSRIAKNFDDRVGNPIRMLKVQHRMHPEISLFPNNTFYKGQLKNSPTCVARQDEIVEILPYYVFNINLQHNQSREYNINAEEIECIAKLLEAMDNILVSIKRRIDIGIITPYNSQKDALSNRIERNSFCANLAVTINTVDSFQGLEKDIIIISCVRFSPNTFLGDEQRINVALTRAKYALYVVGTYTLFKNCALLSRLKVDAEKRKLYSTIKSFSTDSLKRIIRRN